ncbi:hypothetical protein BDK61_4730 [Haloarcula quadrata]|jgi:hypothetical protein|uniref:Uncharacterized protein n=1 Tax=Haloarcula quadrata TaxID=182779 RepID=A0A495QQG5_9EURY|nr:hypothetical protein BDK61_4730 [Haloarcula quadrata]
MTTVALSTAVAGDRNKPAASFDHHCKALADERGPAIECHEATIGTSQPQLHTH